MLTLFQAQASVTLKLKLPPTTGQSEVLRVGQTDGRTLDLRTAASKLTQPN